MNFKSIQEKLTQQADEVWKIGAKKLELSKITIQSKQELEEYIKKSKNTQSKNPQTGKIKTYTHRCIVFAGDPKSDFFKHALYKAPFLLTKGFSQNIPVKLISSTCNDVKFELYGIKTFPSIIIFEDTKLLKVIHTPENITKLVNSLDLDINKTINAIV